MEEAKGGQCGGSQVRAMKVQFSGVGTWRMFKIGPRLHSLANVR